MAKDENTETLPPASEKQEDSGKEKIQADAPSTAEDTKESEAPTPSGECPDDIKTEETTPVIEAAPAGDAELPVEKPIQDEETAPQPPSENIAATQDAAPPANAAEAEKCAKEESTAQKSSPPKKGDKNSEAEEKRKNKDPNKENGVEDSKKSKEGGSSSAEKRVKIQRIQVGKENLWVSNVSKDTTAKDLKNLFSKYGKVQAVKIVTSARSSSSNAVNHFGFVTMSTPEEAHQCIKSLNNTELKGQLISIESAKQGRSTERTHSTSSSRSARKRSRSRDSDRRRQREGEMRRISRERPYAKFRRVSPYRRSPPPRRISQGEGIYRRSRSPRRLPSPPRYRARPSPPYRGYFPDRSRSPVRRSPPPGRFYDNRPEPSMLTFDMIREERIREQGRQRGKEPPPPGSDKLSYLQEHNFKEMLKLEQEREQIRKEKEALERERAEILELEKQKQYEMRMNIEKEMRILEERKSKLQLAKGPSYGVLPPAMTPPSPSIHWPPPPAPHYSGSWMSMPHMGGGPYEHRPNIYDTMGGGPKK